MERMRFLMTIFYTGLIYRKYFYHINEHHA
jgi:hypothetical protein